MQEAANPEPDFPEKQPGYGALRGANIDSVLEIGIVKIGLDGSGGMFTPQSNLYATARARLLRLADGTVLSDAPYEAMSAPMTAEEWSKGNAETFRRQLQLVLQDLAEQIVDHLFLEYHTQKVSTLPFTRSCQQAPLPLKHPAPTHNPCTYCFRGRWGWTFPQVETVQPVLSWEAFSNPSDSADRSKGELSVITDMRYDLRIFTAKKFGSGLAILDGAWMPADLVYRRSLSTPSHQVEIPLLACSHYFLTYRARFELNGQPRSTRWAGTYNAGPTACIMTTEPEKQFPSRHYYGFKTPCPSVSKN